jgi:tetratricopeptide (TPR) repeat protein
MQYTDFFEIVSWGLVRQSYRKSTGHVRCSVAPTNFLLLGAVFLGQISTGYSVQAKKIEIQIPQAQQAPQTPQNETISMLEIAANVLEKKIQNGSAAALNQIASAFYTLGECWEKKAKEAAQQNTENKQNEHTNKAEDFYKKATNYFCKAAKAGCDEAVYNAGLAFSKLQNFDEAASFYRQCIKKDEGAPLALKAAVNLAILILEKHIAKDNVELQQLVRIGQGNTGKRAETLLQTTVIILTDMNSESDMEEGKADQSLQPKVLLTSETVTTPAT